MNNARKGWKRPGRLVPLALVLLVILGFTAFRIASRSGVKRQIEALRAKGFPTTEVELDKWYARVPAGENAAIAFLDAYAYYVEPVRTNNPSENNKVKMSLGQPLPPLLAEQVKFLLSRNRETIQALHAGAELTRSRYPIDMTRGFATLLPHLAQLKRLGQLLKWEAIQQSTEGNPEAALKAIKSGFAVAASLDDEPILISALVRNSILQEMLPAMERVITEQKLTAADLEALERMLAHTEERGRYSLKRSISGERGFGLPGFELSYTMLEQLSGNGNSPSGELPQVVNIGIYELRRVLGVNDTDKKFFLNSLRAYEGTLDREYPEMLREARRINDGVMETMQRSRVRYLVSGMLLPSLDGAIQKAAINAGFLRCARAAVSVERFRLKNGQMPDLDGFEDLVPEYLPVVPLDPVKGEPLRIEKLSEGYRVVADDATELKTNGGKKKGEGEVAFSVLK